VNVSSLIPQVLLYIYIYIYIYSLECSSSVFFINNESIMLYVWASVR